MLQPFIIRDPMCPKLCGCPHAGGCGKQREEKAEMPEMKDGDREEHLGMVLVQGRTISALRLQAACLPVPLLVLGARPHPKEPERRQCFVHCNLL